MQSLGAIHEDLSRILSFFLAAPFMFFTCELSVRRVVVDVAPGRARQQRPAPIGSRPSSSCPHCSWPPKVHRSSPSLGHWCSLAGFVPLFRAVQTPPVLLLGSCFAASLLVVCGTSGCVQQHSSAPAPCVTGQLDPQFQ